MIDEKLLIERIQLSKEKVEKKMASNQYLTKQLTLMLFDIIIEEIKNMKPAEEEKQSGNEYINYDPCAICDRGWISASTNGCKSCRDDCLEFKAYIKKELDNFKRG